MYVTRQPSDLGFMPNGDLLVVSTHEGHILRIVDAEATVVADIGAHHPSGINDMLVDERGRAYLCTPPMPQTSRPANPRCRCSSCCLMAALGWQPWPFRTEWRSTTMGRP